MSALSSLTNRIFFATAFLAVLCIGVAIAIVNVAVTRQAEDELRHGLDEAASLVAGYRSIRFEHFANEARLIADLPRLKAAVDTSDPATVHDLAEDYQNALKADFFIITRRGQLLARLGAPNVTDRELLAMPWIASASSDREVTGFLPIGHGVLQGVSVPIVIDREVFGNLHVGVTLDGQAAARFKTLTNSEIAFAADGEIQAATLPETNWPLLAALLKNPGITPKATIDGNEYIVLTLPLAPSGTPGSATALILRSRTERLRFLRTLHTMLGAMAVLAVLAATLLSYAIARSVTRPLGTITATMREMADTGDHPRRI
jgi:hypothetical protein